MATIWEAFELLVTKVDLKPDKPHALSVVLTTSVAIDLTYPRLNIKLYLNKIETLTEAPLSVVATIRAAIILPWHATRFKPLGRQVPAALTNARQLRRLNINI